MFLNFSSLIWISPPCVGLFEFTANCSDLLMCWQLHIVRGLVVVVAVVVVTTSTYFGPLFYLLVTSPTVLFRFKLTVRRIVAFGCGPLRCLSHSLRLFSFRTRVASNWPIDHFYFAKCVFIRLSKWHLVTVIVWIARTLRHGKCSPEFFRYVKQSFLLNIRVLWRIVSRFQRTKYFI